MTALSTFFGGLSTPVLVALLTLAAVQLTLQVFALIDLARRPLVAGGRKWIWVLVTVLGGIVGAAAYLAVGRTPLLPLGADEPKAGTEAARRRALDALYGPDKHP